MKKLNIFIICSIFTILLSSCNTEVWQNDNKDNLQTNQNEMKKETKKEIKWTVTLDVNLPLAGKNLTFDIEMMKIDWWTVVASGSKVEVNYTWTLDDGTKFDSSYDRWETLPFTAWAGQMIAWFDKAVMWMKVWDKKTVKIEAKDAYGEYDPTKVQVVPKASLESFINAWYKLEKWEKIPTQMWELLIIDSTDE